MVKKDIAEAIARKGVKDGPNEGIVLIFDKLGEIAIGSQGGDGKFEDEQRRHQVRDEPVGEKDGKPEKGAADEIEGIGADEIDPQVGLEAPEQVAVMHSLVGHFIKRDLLGVEVAVEDKIPLIKNDKGEEDHDAYEQRQKKGAEILFFLVAFRSVVLYPFHDNTTNATEGFSRQLRKMLYLETLLH